MIVHSVNKLRSLFSNIIIFSLFISLFIWLFIIIQQSVLLSPLEKKINSLYYKGHYHCADINQWDVSMVTDMSGLFKDKATFNCDISFWDVSNVTNMNDMFSGASNFNRDLSRWDVSNVTNMDVTKMRRVERTPK